MMTSVLIVTNDAVAMTKLECTLCSTGSDFFQIKKADSFSVALDYLHRGCIDVMLLDLILPDSQGMATLHRLSEVTPDMPVFILGDVCVEVMQNKLKTGCVVGYLSKDCFSSDLLVQIICNMLQLPLKKAVIVSDVTHADIVLNSINDGVICTDLNGNVDYLNLAAEHLTQWSKLHALGQAIEDVMPIVHSGTRKSTENPVQSVLKSDMPTMLEPGSALVRPDGSELEIEDSTSPIHDVNGTMVGAVMVFHEITAIQARSAKMAYFAQHDFLTNLPNRILLNDRIAQAISLARRNHTQLAILFLDLDNFKQTNDTFGHAVGDLLLQSVTEGLCSCVRHSDTVSRQGGDEFVILINADMSGNDASLIAFKILKSLSTPRKIGDNILHVTTSIGISIFPVDGEDAESLIKHADIAMYKAKEKGGNNYQLYQNE